MNFRFEATSWSSPLPYNSRCSVRLVWPLAHEIIRATIIYCYQSSCFWPVGAFVPSQSRSVEGSGVSRVSPGNRTRNPSFFFFFLYLLLSALSSSMDAKLPCELSYRPFLQFSMRSPLLQTRCIEIPPYMWWMLVLFLFFFLVQNVIQNERYEVYDVIWFFFKVSLVKLLIFLILLLTWRIILTFFFSVLLGIFNHVILFF